MHNNRLKICTSIALVTVTMTPRLASASSYYIQEQSAKGAGRAFSGEVADEGAQSLWWNPASIGGLQTREAQFSITAIIPRADVNNVNTLIIRPLQPAMQIGGDQRAHNPIDSGVVPSGAIALPIGPRFAVGLTLTSPYNTLSHYGSKSWARYTADETSLRTYDIQPSMAVMVTPNLSIGAGLNIEYLKSTFSNYLPNLSPLLPDGYQSLNGDGWDMGWSAGVQYRSGPLVLGASYKSSVKHNLRGTLENTGLLGPLASQNGVTATEAKYRTPWQATVGARVAVSPKVTLNAQVVRVGFEKFDAIKLGAPFNMSIPENYRDSWSAAAGIDYALSPRWTVRTGLQYDQTPTQNGERDARSPDSNRWNLAAGASFALSPTITIDAAATYNALKDATVDRPTAAYAGSAAQTLILADGQVTDAHIIALSFGGRFRF